MPNKKQIDRPLDEESDDPPSETFLGAIEEDGEIVSRERLRVRRGTNRRPVKRAKTDKDPRS